MSAPSTAGQDRALAEQGDEGGHRSKRSGPCSRTPSAAHSAADARASHRNGHVPVQRHRGLDAAAPKQRGPMARHPRPPPGAAARRLRGARRRRGRHRGRLVLRRLPDGARRRRPPRPTSSGRSPPSRGRTGWRCASASASTPARPACRRRRTSACTSTAPAGSPASVTAARCSSPTRRASLVCRLAAGRREPAGPRRASAEGPRASGATVAAGHRRAAVRLPGGQLPRRDAEQPADPADDLPRSRRRDRGHRPAAGRSPAADAHRSRRNRQDAAQPRGRGALDAPLPRRCLVRGARDDHRPGPRPVDDRAGAQPLRTWRHDADRARHRPPRGEAGAARPRQLRAGARGGGVGERAPRRLPEPRRS